MWEQDQTISLKVMMGNLEFGNGKSFNFKQRNLIHTLGAGDTSVNKIDKNPCPPVAYGLIWVSKRSLWLLHGEGLVGEQERRQGDGLVAAMAVQGQGDLDSGSHGGDGAKWMGRGSVLEVDLTGLPAPWSQTDFVQDVASFRDPLNVHMEMPRRQVDNEAQTLGSFKSYCEDQTATEGGTVL